jgi:hypothetical protein
VGAEKAGRRADDLKIVPRRAIRVAESTAAEREALDFFRNMLAAYGSARTYQNALIDLGYRAPSKRFARASQPATARGR